METKVEFYSDGDIEDKIIETLKAGKDVFDIPYNGGAVFHNFTDARENLINWYPFEKDASVLEIGAGMGALTGLLCQKCDSVTAFEHSPKRAEIIRYRYPEYSNLNVVCGDVLSYNFEQKYAAAKARHEQILKGLNYEYDLTELEKAWFEGIEYLKQFHFVDSEHEVNNLLKDGKSVLCEGAQGTMLDIDFGSYPFVTSSNTVCAGACTGLGVAPNRIGEVYGIFKAYCTRVGAGPFPSELFDETGDKMCTLGHEFGSVTGRKRRCGWIDLVALKYSVMINGVTKLIMMKSDVLDTFETIKACVAYKVNGEEIDYFPYDITEGVEPVYAELPGWQTDMTKMQSEDEFPEEFNAYLTFLEEQLGVEIKIVSVGPDRAQTIERYTEE